MHIFVKNTGCVKDKIDRARTAFYLTDNIQFIPMIARAGALVVAPLGFYLCFDRYL